MKENTANAKAYIKTGSQLICYYIHKVGPINRTKYY